MVQWMLFLKLSGHSFDAQLYDQDVPAVKINWRSSNRCDDCRILLLLFTFERFLGPTLMHSKVKNNFFLIFENLSTNLILKSEDRPKICLDVEVYFTVSVP
jgi:hypothetical protein